MDLCRTRYREECPHLASRARRRGTRAPHDRHSLRPPGTRSAGTISARSCVTGRAASRSNTPRRAPDACTASASPRGSDAGREEARCCCEPPAPGDVALDRGSRNRGAGISVLAHVRPPGQTPTPMSGTGRRLSSGSICRARPVGRTYPPSGRNGCCHRTPATRLKSASVVTMVQLCSTAIAACRASATSFTVAPASRHRRSKISR